jgi:KDO2-lipid IV(A) lauroyltransferase
MVFGESPLKDLYRRVVWGPYRWVLELAPATAEVRVNRALGRLAAAALAGERESLESKLRAALGEFEDVSAVAQLCFQTHFANQYVGFGFAKMGPGQVGRYLEFEGIEHVDSALAQGRGVVLAHPHMGLPQLALHAMGLIGYDVHQVGGGRTAVTMSAIGEGVTRLRDELETRICATLHDGQAYVRPLLRALEGNGVVFTACDGTGGGEELGRRSTQRVLGQAYSLPVFPVWLCQKTGAAMVPMNCTAEPSRPWRQRVRFEEAIPAKDEEVALGMLADRLSAWLRQAPGDWHFWDHWHRGEGGLLADDKLHG